MPLSGPQLHLLVNHLPVVLPGLALPIITWGLWSKSKEIRGVGLALILVGGALAIAAYLTGRPAEGVVKNYPASSPTLIDQHAAAAQWALISMLVDAAAGAALVFADRSARAGAPAWVAFLVLTLFVEVVMLRTAHLGGLITHEELRRGSEISAW